jgi:hypothetical protein
MSRVGELGDYSEAGTLPVNTGHAISSQVRRGVKIKRVAWIEPLPPIISTNTPGTWSPITVKVASFISSAELQMCGV